MRIAALTLPAVLLLALAPLPAAAQEEAAEDTAAEIGILGGAELHDPDLAGPGESGKVGPALGVRGGAMINPTIGWFADLVTSPFDVPGEDDPTSLTGRVGLSWFPYGRPVGRWSWFLDGAVGYTDISGFPGDASVSRPLLSYGIGQRRPTGRNAWRWEVRVDRTLGSDGIEATVTDVLALVGWSWSVGAGPRDEDRDGVGDRKDGCPQTPIRAIVDERGCPIDQDGDRVYDGIDGCPDTPKGWPVDALGCPLDGDGDGIYDGEDACPGTPPGAAVDGKGCPEDRDADRVLDGIDRCPDTPRGAQVDARGCPLDTDGDGVFDGIDRCPGTPRGTEVDAADGCPMAPPPAPAPEKAPAPFAPGKSSLVLEGVAFEVDSARLTPGSREVLDRVASSLRDWPEVKVEVAGHTDTTGSAAYNQRLSAARAASVKDYLVSRGVAPSRLVAVGYGESRPIADDATDAGKARNRRVELVKK